MGSNRNECIITNLYNGGMKTKISTAHFKTTCKYATHDLHTCTSSHVNLIVSTVQVGLHTNPLFNILADYTQLQTPDNTNTIYIYIAFTQKLTVWRVNGFQKRILGHFDTPLQDKVV